MLKIVICEDDRLWLENLVRITEKIISKNHLDAEIVLQSNEIKEVQAFIRKNQANVFLLDIDFQGEEDGLHLARIIRKADVNAYIVFISAHLEYIMLAFKVQAFDFLPKPVTLEVLENMLRSIQNHNLQKTNAGNQNQKLRFKNGASIISIFISDISYIEKIGYETYIHMNNKSTKCCRRSLDSLEKELAGSNLIRCHRAYIINKSRILELRMKEKSVILDNGEICPIGGKYKQELLENCISEQMILGNTPPR